jgi:hypothetical protein
MKLFQFDRRDAPIFSRSANAIRSLGSCNDTHGVTRFEPSEDFSLSHFGDKIACAKRNGRYLNWRYFDVPKHKYQAIKIADQFAIFRIEPIMGAEVSVVRILEWTFAADNGPSALAWIIRASESQRPILMDFYCSCESIGRSIEQFGFVRQCTTSKPMPDLFRPTNYSDGIAVAIDLPPHRTARQIDFRNWYITAGDSDVDRVKL